MAYLFISPLNQNTSQRIGFISSIIGMLIVVFLHNPFDGYITEKNTTYSRVDQKDCGEEKLKEYYALFFTPDEVSVEGNKRLHRKNELNKECFELVSGANDEPLALLESTSEKPILLWLGPITHFFITLASILIAGFAWIFTFKDSK